MSLTKPYEGAGLGLSITKAYIEILGGRIWIESKKNEGTQFFFTIPYQQVKKQKQISQEENQDSVQSKSLKGLSILAAEDDEITKIYLTEILKDRCKELIHVRTGKEAIEALKSNKQINLILMDLKMPEMDGYTATQEIRKFNQNIIIIAQTAYALSDDRDKAIDAGCNGYISKPVEMRELLNLLESYTLIE